MLGESSHGRARVWLIARGWRSTQSPGLTPGDALPVPPSPPAPRYLREGQLMEMPTLTLPVP